MDFDSLMKQYAAGGASSEGLGSGAVSSSGNAFGEKRAFRRRRFPPRQPGKVEDLGGGEYKLDAMYSTYELWNDDWCGRPDDIIVCFEAKAANDVTVLLAIEKGATTGNLYEVVIGGWKNTKSACRTEPEGQERAASFEGEMCNPYSFLSYWVALKDGVLAAGLGEKPGHNPILAWKHPQHDPEDAQPCWIAFSSWDSMVNLRNVRIFASSDFDYDWVAELGDQDAWTAKYIPPYIAALEQERAINIARAQRFGVKFVPPPAKQVLNQMPPEERERARAAMAGRITGGFVTGLDMESAEEQENRKARAARFGISAEDAEPSSTASVANTLSSTVSALLPSDADLTAKRNRAARFGVPLNEQVKLVAISPSVPSKRRDISAGDTVRRDTLHIFGDLSHISSRHIRNTFQDFSPSALEWLNDFSCNIAFADQYTCDRARAGLCRDIPGPLPLPAESQVTPERTRFDEELNQLITSGWKFTAIKDGKGDLQYILVRNATSADVKDSAPQTSMLPSSRKREVTEPERTVEELISGSDGSRKRSKLAEPEH